MQGVIDKIRDKIKELGTRPDISVHSVAEGVHDISGLLSET
jgi:hypothetical protein